MKVISRDSHHVEHPFQDKMFEKLWEPISIGSLKLKNRIAMAPIQRLPAENVWPDMHPTHILFHEAIAKGGAGLIVFGECDVTPGSQGTVQNVNGKSSVDPDRGIRRPTKGIWSDDAMPGWVKLFDACHKHGARVMPALSSYARWIPKTQALRGEGIIEFIIPDWKESGMTPEALEAEKKNYVAAAVRAKKAGADGVQLAGTRESLIAILVSQIRNPGVPGYSEDLKARVRFPVEIIREIKAACGQDFPITIRISAVEYMADGYGIEYSKQVAKECVDAGIDAIDVTQAGFSTQVPQLQMVVPPGAYAHYARAVKSYLSSLGAPYDKVVIMNACRIQNPWIAASMLRNGDCDIVSVCRELIADPDWPNKIKEGRIDDIVPCTGCVWCMRSSTCAVNPQSPFYKSAEQTKGLQMTRAARVKKVIVAGGGLAGMVAARALALRGHKVTLYEKEADLGMRVYVQGLAPFRTDMDLMRRYFSTQIKKLGVDIRCNQEVTPALVENEKPDAVVVATGCRPTLPAIAGIAKHPHVVCVEDVLLERVDVGKKVLVIDAEVDHDLGSLGSFTAQFVARSACLRDDVAAHITRWSPQHTAEDVKVMANTPVGRDVTIVTRAERVADVEYHHYTTVEDLRRMGVNVFLKCRYKEVNEKGLVMISDGEERLIEADTIITSDYESVDELYKVLEGKVPELHLVGDARNIQIDYIANVHGPYRTALRI
ncbi:MAG: FAD-dependent oxidoreductase [Chloroflexi bacterium]|nr:FAD-dependent oxidoreductase [Chloroflexota bacterium]